MGEDLLVRKSVNGNECTLKVSGFLDYSSMDPFIKGIRSIEEGIEKVIVNFGELEFIDSTGIGAIINLAHEANDRHFEVELVGMNPEVRDLFETIGVFDIMSSLQKEGS